MALAPLESKSHQNSSGPDSAKFNAWASSLHERGSLCDSSCVAQCGRLILSPSLAAEEGVNTKIVECFKSSCGCRHSTSSLTEPEQFSKFQEDLRIDHLLLEKEISDMVSSFGYDSPEQPLVLASESEPEYFKFESRNVLLERIVKNNFADKARTRIPNMTSISVGQNITLTLITLAAVSLILCAVSFFIY